MSQNPNPQPAGALLPTAALRSHAPALDGEPGAPPGTAAAAAGGETLPLGAREDYNAVPYPRHAQTWTHPRRMAALAHLIGLEHADPLRCRVLELGCATGSNLIPIACSLPESECVGIDLAEKQIAIGQRDIEAIGQQNVRLFNIDVRELGQEFGQFDYIICHGIYSWVPADVRTAILESIGALLTPHGMAYVSYNVNPGWHLQQPMRQGMLFHTRNLPGGLERAKAAIDFLPQWAAGLTEVLTGQAWLVRSISDRLTVTPDDDEESRLSYVLHEFLADHNSAFYFHEFAAECDRHGLQYLTDAEFATEFPRNLSDAAVELIQGSSGNLTEMLQYLDFFTFRMFRRSLLVRKGRAINRSLNAHRLLPLWVHSLAVEELPSPTLNSELPLSVVGSDDVRITTNQPLAKAALRILTENQRITYQVSDLIGAAHARLLAEADGAEVLFDDEEVEGLLNTLMRALCNSDFLLAINAGRPPYALHLPERPRASRWAARQAFSEHAVTTLRLERMMPDPMERDLIRVLDGTLTAEDVIQEWMAAITDGRIVLGNPPLPPEDAMKLLPKAVDERIRLLQRNALLEA